MYYVFVRTFFHFLGPPEPPRNLEISHVGADFFAVSWEPGFDGGHQETTFVLEYTRSLDNRVMSLTCPDHTLCKVTGTGT